MLGTEPVYTAGFIKVLEHQGVIKKVGKQPAEGGRGKPSDIFEVPNEVTLVFWQDDATPADATPEVEEKAKEELGVESATVG